VWDDTYGVWRVRGSVNNWAGISGTTGSPTTDTIGSATVYIFKSNGSITVDVDGIAHILLVGGGGRGGTGAAGNANGGGGGAGGVLELTQAYLPAGTHDIRVGAGSTVSGILLPHGGASRLGPYYALGGGDGGYWFGGYEQRGQNGGSGGGTRDYGANAGLGTPGQGNNGGTGAANNGGGGAGEAGNTDGVGFGGDGVTVSIINSTVATSRSVGQVSGSDVYFGGGGSSGAVNGGGLGGGANQHAAGTANTGGGGGGGDSGNETSGAGGSGVVIVRIGG
jgi:hypothetical protein